MQTFTPLETAKRAPVSPDRPDRASRKAPRTSMAIGRDVFVALLLVSFVIFGCFHKTVISGTPISKLAELAELDTFFSQKRYSVYRPKSDPSLYQFHVPFQIFNEHANRLHQIPLWNPNNGCGFPVVGELQYCLFSPFRFIFRAGEPYLYNLGIVMKAATAVVGAFVFARLLGISTIASVLVATAYGLSPFVLRELELPNEVELLPVTLAIFLSLGFKRSLLSRSALGVLAAVGLTTMHPEFFFLNMVMGAALVLLISIFWKAGGDAEETKTAPSRPSSVAGSLLVAGSIAFCLGAPLIFSFLDLLKNGQTYKFGEFVMQYVPVQAFLAAITHPAFGGGSPFMGILAAVLIPLSLLKKNSRVRALTVIAVVAFIASTVPGPFHSIAEMKPFCFVPPRYCLAPLLLALAALAGFGLDYLIGLRTSPRESGWILLTLSAATVVAVPISIIQFKLNGAIGGFDGTLPPGMVTASALTRDITLVVAALSAAFLLSAVRIPYRATILALSIVALNLSSLLPATRVALSPMPPFNYPDNQVLRFLVDSGERVLPLSKHFFFPNVSMAYGLRDLRYTGPIFLDRAPGFAWLCVSGEARRARAYFEQPIATPAIDLASVKYIFSRVPVLSTADNPFKNAVQLSVLRDKPVRVTDDLSLIAAAVSINKNSRDAIMQLEWQAPEKADHDFILEPVIVDDRGSEIQTGDRHPIAKIRDGRRLMTMTVGVPKSISDTRPVNLAVRVFSTWTDSDIWPVKSSLKTIGSRIILHRFTLADREALRPSERRFKLLEQTADGHRIYENTTALPQSYFVSTAIQASDGEDAYRAISDRSFSPRRSVVLEGASASTSAAAAAPDLVPARVTRPSPNEVSVEVEAPHDGWLVLTDSYYPGWHAYVDGKETEILRANYAFRAVPVAGGWHRVEFRFFPEPLKLGILVATITLVSLFLAFAVKAIRRRDF